MINIIFIPSRMNCSGFYWFSLIISFLEDRKYCKQNQNFFFENFLQTHFPDNLEPASHLVQLLLEVCYLTFWGHFVFSNYNPYETYVGILSVYNVHKMLIFSTCGRCVSQLILSLSCFYPVSAKDYTQNLKLSYGSSKAS